MIIEYIDGIFKINGNVETLNSFAYQIDNTSLHISINQDQLILINDEVEINGSFYSTASVIADELDLTIIEENSDDPPKFFFQDTEPGGLIDKGSFWYNSATDIIYLYTNDGDSNQWVSAIGPRGEQGPIGATGATGPGAIGPTGATGPTTVQINEQTGTTYSLVLSDAGKYIRINNASPITLTVPTNASVGFDTGVVISVEQQGAGVISVTASSGVTVNTFNGLDTAGQYAVAQLVKVDTDIWTLIGGVS